MAALRVVLGCAQMIGAATTLVLLIRTGITTLSLGVLVVTGALTAASVLLFRKRSGPASPRA